MIHARSGRRVVSSSGGRPAGRQSGGGASVGHRLRHDNEAGCTGLQERPVAFSKAKGPERRWDAWGRRMQGPPAGRDAHVRGAELAPYQFLGQQVSNVDETGEAYPTQAA